MKPSKNLAQWLSVFLVGFALIAVYKMFDSLAEIGGMVGSVFKILTPFVAGFVIAFLLYAPAKRVEALFLRGKGKFWKKIARPVSVAIVYLLGVGVLALAVYLAVPALVKALIDFVNAVPTYYQNVMGLVQDLSQEGGLLAGFDVQEKLRELYAQLQQYLTVDRILEYARSVLSFTSSVVDVLMAVVVSVYMLLGREHLFRAVRSVSGLFMKERSLCLVSGYLHKTAKIFYSYVYSQLVDAVVVSVLATIGFLLARMPNPVALGIMMGALNLIPYFGAIIGGVLSVLIALMSGNFYGALFIGIYILVMQQIDANIIQPRIVSDNVGLKPIYVLLGITICGGLLGFWGILLGAPVMAVVQMLLTDYIAYREQTTANSETLPADSPRQ